MRHYIYLLGNKLTEAGCGESLCLVAEFDADVGCDYVTNMIEINKKLGHPDAYWTEIEELVHKEGI